MILGEKMTDLQLFLKSERKKNMKRFVCWLTILFISSVIIVGGVCWSISLFT